MRQWPLTRGPLSPGLVLLGLAVVVAVVSACGGAGEGSSDLGAATASPVAAAAQPSPDVSPQPGADSDGAEQGAEAPDSAATAAPTAAPTTVPTASPTPRADEPGEGISSEPSEEAGEGLPPESPPVPAPAASTVGELLAIERILVIGHAGGDRSWPHSTMYAFSEAARAGVDVLEMDLQMTADGILVVHHDDTVDGTTGSTGRVRDLAYEELQQLDNGYWWSEQWPSRDLADDAYRYRGVRTGQVPPPAGYGPDDFRIETFRAVAGAFPEFVFDVEIKTPAGDDGNDDVEFIRQMAVALAAEIEELGRADSVIVASFSDDALAAFREHAPEVVTSPGQNALAAWAFASASLHPNDLVLQVPPTFNGIDVLTEELLAKAAEEGLAVWVWPNEAWQEHPDYYAELIDLPVDGIIAARPAQAIDQLPASAQNQ